MAQDYNEYLAANVLNEQQYVTYRLLSRTLKVHSNLAKQMLYEFHRKQNSKKPGSVHATYLLTGIRRIEAPQQANGVHEADGEDTVMQSSPPLPSSSIPMQNESMEEAKLIRTILLVKEEDLEQAKNTFDTISSIHIYSLEAHPLKDVQVLADCNRKIGAEYASEDPLEAWKQYGTIQNPNVKRRARGTVLPPPAPAPKSVDMNNKPDAQPTKPKEPTAAAKPDSKPTSNTSTPEPEKKGPAAKPAPTKRQNSDIFKSFAKAKTQPKAATAAKGESQSSTEATQQGEDAAMTGFSSDDGDDAGEEPEEDARAPDGKSKNEREAELKAMMDAEDDDNNADEEMEDAATPAADSPAGISPPETKEEPKETVTVENGRRRGRRRVMKKKTVKDEEGYLVTREEAVWESFSEDEPAPKKLKTLPAAASAAAGKAGAGAKKGAKPGQVNIMSFFGKK